MSEPNEQAVRDFLETYQERACTVFEAFETQATFRRDPWQQGGGSRGETRVLEEGVCFEKAGVNFSHVYGDALPQAATARHPELAGCTFQAMGVSIVCHPRNPYAPTAHCNTRFFIAHSEQGEAHWWFGGGFDLTPYYSFAEDVCHWREQARKACAPFGEEIYSRFSEWCDTYFYLPHRGESRGIGGLFFDDLNEWDFARCFALMQSVADGFLEAYVPLVERRWEISYGERERAFQKYRRGRYVEFNLLYDRGTLFGLQNSQRAESILMSLPPKCTWSYDYQPAADSPEAEMMARFRGEVDWA